MFNYLFIILSSRKLEREGEGGSVLEKHMPINQQYSRGDVFKELLGLYFKKRKKNKSILATTPGCPVSTPEGP